MNVAWKEDTAARLARAFLADEDKEEELIQRLVDKRVKEIEVLRLAALAASSKHKAQDGTASSEHKAQDYPENTSSEEPAEEPEPLDEPELLFGPEDFFCSSHMPSDDETGTDEEDATMQEDKAAKTKFRYGNKDLGPVDPERPEVPGLACQSTFNKYWRCDPVLRKIIVREHLPFAKCNICIRHRQKAERKRTDEVMEEDRVALRAHLEEVKNEKLMYYSNRSRGRHSFLEFLSIIIDGADQSKHDLPHFKDQSKMSDEMAKVKMHLYGALVHGRGAYAFTIPDHEKQGHNATIQVLQHILEDLKRKGGSLPPVLKLQLDNTTKQNKGQFLYGYLAMLVEFGVFREVEVSFLPVGHTHEDIDQFFSRVSMYFRHHDVFSREEMSKAVRSAYTFKDTGQPPTVVHWDTIANVSEFLASYTNNFAAGCMSFRHVRFFRSNTDQKVWLQVTSKMNSWGDALDPWRGLQQFTTHTVPFATSYGVPNFDRSYDLRGHLPDASTRPCKMTIKEQQKVRENLHSLHQFFENFTESHLVDIENMLNLAKAPPAKWPWSRENVVFLFGTKPGQGAANSQQQQLHQGLPLPEVGKAYLCRSADKSEQFCLGIVKGHTQDGNVHMQYFTLPHKRADAYQSVYKAVLDTATRSECYPEEEAGVLQYGVQMSKIKKLADGTVTSFNIHANEIPNCKYYAAVFRGGKDLECRSHERRV